MSPPRSAMLEATPARAAPASFQPVYADARALPFDDATFPIETLVAAGRRT